LRVSLCNAGVLRLNA